MRKLQLCSFMFMQSLQSHGRLHAGQTLEQLTQTGRRHGLAVLDFPGHRFSALGGHDGPGFQQASRMETVLTLRDESRLLREPDLAPDLGMLRRPRSDLEPRLSAGDLV